MYHEIWIITVVLFVQQSHSVDIAPQSVSIPRVCLNGVKNELGNCVCKPGFGEYRGNCFQTTAPSTCPLSSNLWNGVCKPTYLPREEVIPAMQKYVVVPPLRVQLDPVYTEQAVPDDEDGEDDNVYTPSIQDQYFNVSYHKIVNNGNVIKNETTHHTKNVNNFIVHITRKKGNGIRTVVIRNNETTVHEEEPSKNQTAIKDDDGSEEFLEGATTTEAPIANRSCCTIVSPRVCRKQSDEWVCFHRKQYVCSKVCTAKTMYLKPKKPYYQDPWLIMPPMLNPFAQLDLCQFGECPQPDCSGCLQGRRRCHPTCYTYDCMRDNSCQFIDLEEICKNKTEGICGLLGNKTAAVPTPQNQKKKTNSIKEGDA
ncbi:uncharacterized protein LOC128717833 [Anopheles marshallii]|uniref:uncharacterized protein LOC128717833 n=1 Tax=Anopheles marshallii TaxID=1521116 RepID=UPI00237ADA21|nr:uncharacterized protein LOC128717833 [Anopheles marshallii]